MDVLAILQWNILSEKIEEYSKFVQSTAVYQFSVFFMIISSGILTAVIAIPLLIS